MSLRDLALIIFILGIAVAASYSQSPDARSIVGTWSNGAVSLLVERNTTTGSTTPSNGHTWTYKLNADGTFSFVGLLNSTTYGCTMGIFNEKNGHYEVAGGTITFRPTRNFWRKTNSCAPSSNSERNYVLDPESYAIRTKTDENGLGYICLVKEGSSDEKVETCYHREAVRQ